MENKSLGFVINNILIHRLIRLLSGEMMRQPLVVSYGLGVDSTAMLIGLHQKGIKPDLILFANTGGEKPETYDYFNVIGRWLQKVGFPPVIVVGYRPKNFKNWPPYYTLEDNCLTNGTLPSLAFGFKSCSLKWKVAPQNKYMKSWEPAIKTWEAGFKVIKAIGFDASPADARRRNHVGSQDDPQYEYIYPLQDWNWDRERCKQEIRGQCLPIPPKSSCFFCPAMKPAEVDELQPDLLQRIVKMEARAKPRLTTTEGLWRKTTKAKPGMITEYIRQKGLLKSEDIDRLIAAVPEDIVGYQAGYALAKAEGRLDEFLKLYEETDYREGMEGPEPIAPEALCSCKEEE